jgi:hypothetical protein
MIRSQSRDTRRREDQRYLGILDNAAQSGQTVFQPDGVGSWGRNRYETGTGTCPKGACGIESLRIEQKGFFSWWDLPRETAGKRTHPTFKLAIGQLTLKLEIVTNETVGKRIRLLPASKFEEIREVMDGPMRKFRHA